MPEYCSGFHLCQICGDNFKCNGEEISHSGSGGSGRCHGEILQFCPNHSVEEYIEKHRELNEL